MEIERLTYNVGTAAKILGISRNAAYSACLSGQLANIKIGKRILIPRVALEALLLSAQPKDKP